MRTQGAFYADTAHTGGWYFVPAFDISQYSANLVLTRNALGDYSLNRTAAGAETYYVTANLGLLKRLIEYPGLNNLPFQEQFGTAAGGAGYPANAPGLPPFTGATQLTPATTAPAKGCQVTDVAVVYQVGVVSLTSATLSLNRVAYANAAAKTITNVPISATALTLTSNANPYVAVRAVTTPTFETTDLSDLILEFSPVMANTGTLRVYGLGFHLNFNYD
jgi:hypothetical protein